MSTQRRCALPGCDVPIEVEKGDQPRRYCCAEHRRASRFSRRVQEATKAAEPAADRDVPAADRRTLFEPAGLERPTPAPWRSSGTPLDVAPPPLNRERRRAVNRRQRAIAVLATTAVFASAGWAASTQSSNAPPAAPGAGKAMPSTDQPVPIRTAAQWAIEAQQTLDSVNQQLDLIAQTEEMWNRQLPAVRNGPTPPAVQEMFRRRAVLGQQKALLQLQLDTFRSLDTADRDLSDAEQKVTAANRAIPTDPAMANTPEARRLAEQQRDLLARRLEATRAENASLHGAVEKSVASPLPDRSNLTKPITESVIGLVRDPLRPQPPAEPDKQQPPAVPLRDVSPRPKQNVPSVAPPRPGRPSPGPGDAATPGTSTPAPADSAAAAPSPPPPPNSQPALTMADSWEPTQPPPPQDSPAPEPSQLSSPSSGWGVSRGSNWSADDIRALFRDAPRDGNHRSDNHRGNNHRSDKHRDDNHRK